MSGQTESKFFQTINQEEVKVGSQKEGGYKGIGRRLEAGSIYKFIESQSKYQEAFLWKLNKFIRFPPPDFKTCCRTMVIKIALYWCKQTDGSTAQNTETRTVQLT